VRVSEFAKIARHAQDGPVSDELFGCTRSKGVFDHFTQNGFPADGQVTSKFLPNSFEFSLDLPKSLSEYEKQIIDLVGWTSVERHVKSKSNRDPRALNKQLYWAIVKRPDGEDRVYMIREAESTLNNSKVRPSEAAKINSAKRRFAAIGITDYGRSVPAKWSL